MLFFATQQFFPRETNERSQALASTAYMVSKILSSLFHYKLLEQNLVAVFGSLLDYCPAKLYSSPNFSLYMW